MEIKQRFVPDSRLRLMDQVRQVLRYYHYAYRTEQSYCDWIVRYIRFFDAKRHPRDMGKKEIEAFLSHLASREKVSASTQRQTLNAIIFLYRYVLLQPVEGEIAPVRAKRHPNVPVVMTQGEVKRVLEEMSGTHLLMAKMLYGCGLRLMECERLRVQDLDFERKSVYVRGAKGGKGRRTLFPKAIHKEIGKHLERVRRLHEEDVAKGFGEVHMPEAPARKYPRAGRAFRWQYVFPSKTLSTV